MRHPRGRVRQVVGYDRLVGEHAYRQLTELYRALRLYVNCFQPSMKLLSKERDGKKMRCVYDPAKTPSQRLLLAVLPDAISHYKSARCNEGCGKYESTCWKPLRTDGKRK